MNAMPEVVRFVEGNVRGCASGRRWTLLMCLLVAHLMLLNGTAQAVDVLLPSRSLLLKPGKVVRFVSEKTEALSLPSAGSNEDPTVHGAVLRVFDTAAGGGGSVSVRLDRTGWRALGNPAGSRGYRYRHKDDQTQPDIRCKAAIGKRLRLRVRCRGTIDMQTPFTAAAGVVLGIPAEGSTLRYCAELPGDGGNDAALKHTNSSAPSVCEAVVVETAVGGLRGSTQGDVQSYLGIPFAEAPVGNLRFKAPVPKTPWSQTRDAIAFGAACPQPISESATLYQNQSEDCLNLSVWTPAADGGDRPVMVWIHGGGWSFEGTEDPLYSGAKLAARGDVVVVSIEYRLGAFGFSHLSDLAGPEYVGSGNAAMLDQVLALEWVRDHISRFGGDPDNVTIFGESAGGGSVHALLGMPGAAGLFHNAIAQSGPGAQPRTAAYAHAVSERLLAEAGVTDVAGLVALSTQELLDAQDRAFEAVFISDFLFGTVVDGVVLPEPPNVAIANGSADDVALMAGTVRDETRLYITFLPILAEDLPIEVFNLGIPYIGRALPAGSTFQDATDLYTAERPDATVNQIGHAQGTDIFFRLPMIRLAEVHSSRNPGRTYLYRFDWVPPAPGWPQYDLGVPHGAELGFMLGTPEGWPAIYGDSIPQGLMHQMMDAWIAFARAGNPNHPEMPTWAPYDVAEHQTMIFDTTDTAPTSQLVQDVDGVERAFWDGVPFDSVVPGMAPEDLF